MKRIQKDRDEMAFSEIFDFFAPKVNAYFIQNGIKFESSEELTQEVLSTVWLKSNQYDSSKSALSTWIFTIARNKKIDFLRKNLKINFKEEDIREFLYHDREIDLIEENEAKKQIERINNELDEQQKIMIKMNFFENKSHKKIAAELEIPLGTVKSRLRHILTKMHGFLR
jgi:RNA polymerase sigma-70 factor (ECF subfamily)